MTKSNRLRISKSLNQEVYNNKQNFLKFNLMQTHTKNVNDLSRRYSAHSNELQIFQKLLPTAEGNSETEQFQELKIDEMVILSLAFKSRFSRYYTQGFLKASGDTIYLFPN